jgi:type IV pilus assembly protein PilB
VLRRSHKKLGEILIEHGLITPQNFEAALKEQSRTNEYLGKILIQNSLIKEKDLLMALSEQFDIPLVSLKNKYIDLKAAKSFSASLIRDYKCFPFMMDKGSVTVAITNPLDMWGLKKAEEETAGYKLNLVLVSEEDMQEAIQRYKNYISKDILK